MQENDYGWYAMSATFCRELKAKEYLEGNGVECFIPMRYELIIEKTGGKKKKFVPAIHNLIFAYTTRKRIQELKTGVDYLQYIVKPCEGRKEPVVVPQEQMQQFIKVCDTHNEKLLYLSPEEINLKKGTNVRIVGGVFDGVEGQFVKVEGKRNKRVVVQLQGLVAVATAEITDGYIEVLDKA